MDAADEPPPLLDSSPPVDAGPTFARGNILYAVDEDGQLFSFGSDNPQSSVRAVAPITGTQPGDKILAIDFRPKDGALFALGTSSRIYKVDPETGVATARASGDPFSPALDGAEFGFDFNPVVDRIRVHSDRGQNLRLDPETGLGATGDAGADPALVFTVDGGAFRVTASAYTNSVNPPPLTASLYAIDVEGDRLLLVQPANAGVLNIVGPLGVDATEAAGFDITGGIPTGIDAGADAQSPDAATSGDAGDAGDADGGDADAAAERDAGGPRPLVAYALMTVAGKPGLYTISLGTGAATRVDDLAHVKRWTGLAVR